MKALIISNINDAVPKLLPRNTVGVLPTDTLYGLVARASEKLAVKRLYELKQRDKKPGTLIAASVNQLIDLGIDRKQLLMADKFWPGPVSIVTPVGPALDYLSQGVGSLAIRIPSDQMLVELLHNTGPLITSSANHPGDPPATTVKEAEEYFGNQIDFYIDGGDLSGRAASTIIKIVNDQIIVLRPGAVNL